MRALKIGILLAIQIAFINNYTFAMEAPTDEEQAVGYPAPSSSGDAPDLNNCLKNLYLKMLEMWQAKDRVEMHDLRTQLHAYYKSFSRTILSNRENFIIPLEIDLVYIAASQRNYFLHLEALDDVREFLVNNKQKLIPILTENTYDYELEKINHYISMFSHKGKASVAHVHYFDFNITSDPAGNDAILLTNADFELFYLFGILVHSSEHSRNRYSANVADLLRFGLINRIFSRLGTLYPDRLRFMGFEEQDVKNSMATMEQMDLSERNHNGLVKLKLAAEKLNDPHVAQELLTAKADFAARRWPLCLDSVFSVVSTVNLVFDDNNEFLDGLKLPEFDRGEMNKAVCKRLYFVLKYYVKANDQVAFDRFFKKMDFAVGKSEHWKKIWPNFILYSFIYFINEVNNHLLSADHDDFDPDVAVYVQLINWLRQLPSINDRFASGLMGVPAYRDCVTKHFDESVKILGTLEPQLRRQFSFTLIWMLQNFNKLTNTPDDRAIPFLRVLQISDALEIAYGAQDYTTSIASIREAQALLGNIGTLRGFRKKKAPSKPRRGTKINTHFDMHEFINNNKTAYEYTFLFFEAACAIKIRDEDLKAEALKRLNASIPKNASQQPYLKNLMQLFRLLLGKVINEHELKKFLVEKREQLAEHPMSLLTDLAFFACETLNDENEERLLFQEILRIKAQEPQPSKSANTGKLTKAELRKQLKENQLLKASTTCASKDVSKTRATTPCPMEPSYTGDCFSGGIGFSSSYGETTNLKSEYRNNKKSNKRRHQTTSNGEKEEREKETEKAKSESEESSSMPKASLPDDVINKLLANNVVHQLFRNEKKGIFVNDLIQIMTMAGSSVEMGRGSHRVVKMPYEKPLVFANHREAKEYQIIMVRDWLSAHGVFDSIEKI